MIDSAQLLLFIPAALALNITPGNDMLFCLGQSLKDGPRAGIAASLGIATGGVIHTLLAAFGLASLLAATPWAFEALRWAGVGYLIWLGIQSLRGDGIDFDSATSLKQRSPVKNAKQRPSLYRPWRDGTIVNLFNPKVAIFILAFIPQFVDTNTGSTILQFLILGAIFNVMGTAVNFLVALFAGKVRALFASNQNFSKRFQKITGAVYLALATKLAFEHR